MHVNFVYIVAMSALLASSNFVASAASPSNPTKIETSDLSLLNSVHSRSAPGKIAQRSLRGRATDDEDEMESSEDSEDRAGGTFIVKWAHGLSDSDAKMVRQIAKGNSPAHILDKFGVPYEVIHGQRVYSKYHPVYARYVYWLKRYNDNPLTFPKSS